jgi:ribosome-binding factor A
MAGGRGSHRAPRRATARQYPRTARLNQLLREILGDALEQVDDERLELVTVTSVEVEPDLRHALVFFDSWQGPEGDEELLEALGEWRTRLQGAIGRQAHLKRTPELAFEPDPAVRQGARVETLLAQVQPGQVEVPVDPEVYPGAELIPEAADGAVDPPADPPADG